MSVEDIEMTSRATEPPPPRRRPKRIVFPRRKFSVVIPERKIVYITPDKTTCVECGCYPKEDPYVKHKKLNPCQKSPITLYELAARVVETLPFPSAFEWSEDDVVEWMEHIVGLPEYKECIIDNHIDGMRLLLYEDPSRLPEINIHDFQHIKRIVHRIRLEYGMDFIRFARSIGLPPRRPLVHCTLFKSRTGPSWGIRKNWTRYRTSLPSTTSKTRYDMAIYRRQHRCDILRWMKMVDPAPVYRDHWDLVWYQKPDFPKTLFANVKWEKSKLDVPIYKGVKEICAEYTVPRKFKVLRGIPDSQQYIWMEHRPGSSFFKQLEDEEKEKKRKEKKKKKFLIKEDSSLLPKMIKLEGLRGKDLILARRALPKPKFLIVPTIPVVNV